MIHKIATVSIFVTDYAAAKTFYTEKLGFEVRRDKPLMLVNHA
jgi:catechol 2,3-dioxygenase-like lactoylglutathione lyase family enzyme